MASTTRARTKPPRQRRRPRNSVAGAASQREIHLADELSRCLEDLDRGRTLTSVVRSLRRDVSDEIAPLLRIAQVLRLSGRTLQASGTASSSA